MKFTTLNDDVLVQTLRFLKPVEIAQLRKVSKWMRKQCDSSNLWWFLCNEQLLPTGHCLAPRSSQNGGEQTSHIFPASARDWSKFVQAAGLQILPFRQVSAFPSRYIANPKGEWLPINENSAVSEQSPQLAGATLRPLRSPNNSALTQVWAHLASLSTGRDREAASMKQSSSFARRTMSVTQTGSTAQAAIVGIIALDARAAAAPDIKNIATLFSQVAVVNSHHAAAKMNVPGDLVTAVCENDSSNRLALFDDLGRPVPASPFGVSNHLRQERRQVSTPAVHIFDCFPQMVSLSQNDHENRHRQTRTLTLLLTPDGFEPVQRVHEDSLDGSDDDLEPELVAQQCFQARQLFAAEVQRFFAVCGTIFFVSSSSQHSTSINSYGSNDADSLQTLKLISEGMPHIDRTESCLCTADNTPDVYFLSCADDVPLQSPLSTVSMGGQTGAVNSFESFDPLKLLATQSLSTIAGTHADGPCANLLSWLICRADRVGGFRTTFSSVAAAAQHAISSMGSFPGFKRCRLPGWVCSTSTSCFSLPEALSLIRAVWEANPQHIDRMWNDGEAPMVVLRSFVDRAKALYTEAMEQELAEKGKAETPFWVSVDTASQSVISVMESLYSTEDHGENRSAMNSVTDDNDETDAEQYYSVLRPHMRQTTALRADDETGLLEQYPLYPTAFTQPTAQNGVEINTPAPLTMPVDLDVIAEMHDRYFLLAVRTLIIELIDAGHNDVVAGQCLVELLKTNLGMQYREFWRRNQDNSKSYCRAVCERTMAPLQAHYFAGKTPVLEDNVPLPQSSAQETAAAAAKALAAVVHQPDDSGATAERHRTIKLKQQIPPLKRKGGMKLWYQALREKIEEYCVKARGGRAMDVLWDCVSAEVQRMRSAALVAGCDPADVVTTAASVQKEIEIMQRTFNSHNSDQMLMRQRNSARVTVYISAEFAVKCREQEVFVLRAIRDDARSWEMRSLQKSYSAFASFSTANRMEAAREQKLNDSVQRLNMKRIDAKRLEEALPGRHELGGESTVFLRETGLILNNFKERGRTMTRHTESRQGVPFSSGSSVSSQQSGAHQAPSTSMSVRLYQWMTGSY